MEIRKRNRIELKSYFVKNAIPTETNFGELVDATLNQKDDGIVKLPGNPLSIEASGDATSQKKAINLFSSFADENPSWVISLNPRSNPGDANTARPGFSVSDAAGHSRLFIEQESGHVGIGTVDPSHVLHVRASDAVGLFESTSNQAYLRLSTSEGMNNRIEIANRPGGRLALWVGTGGDALNVVKDGKVGVGRTDPQRQLHVGGTCQISLQNGNSVANDSTAGIFWHSSNDDYGIYRTPGAWSANTYQQLKIRWRTGIIIEPGTGAGAGNDRSYVHIQNGKGLRVTDGTVGIGTLATDYKLTVSHTDSHLQLRRERPNSTGGKVLFLELLQNDKNGPDVPEVFPSIRFHHAHRYWHRIEARPDGFHFKDGNLAADGYRSIHTGNIQANGKIDTTGRIKADHGIRVDGDRSSHINADGALYRTGGQVYLTVDDNFYIRDSSGSVFAHFQTDNRTLSLGRALIMFGGNAAANQVMGGLGFLGSGRQHGQISFRANHGFEFIDVSANGPRLDYNRDGYPYAAIKALRYDRPCSREIKENIADIDGAAAMAALSVLTPVRFNYRDDPDKREQIGFIAEDVPDMVAQPDRKSLSTMEIVALLTKVVKEQQKAIDRLVASRNAHTEN